jgi:alpha-amylase
MLKISSDLEGILGRGESTKTFIKEAKAHLLKGQCNCPYWHGVFGGLYLPHLRHAVSSELAKAQTQLDNIRHKKQDFLSIEETDLDCDGTSEIIVNNKHLSIIVKPGFGGSIPLLVFKDKDYNLQNTLARRYEYYHSEIRQSQNESGEESKSIHDLSRSVSDDMKRNLFYDWHHRYTLLDHFFGEETNLELLNSAKFIEEGDFVNQPYQSQILTTADEIVVTLVRDGHLYRGNDKIPLRLNKNIYIGKAESRIRVVYKIKNLWDQAVKIRPGVEWNFFLLGGDDMEKSFKFDDQEPVSPLVKELTTDKSSALSIVDNRIGMKINLKWNAVAGCWILPIRTVSQSEAGYDFIYQGSAVIPHWELALESGEETTIALAMTLETSD